MAHMTASLSPIVALALIGYFAFSMWNAYSTGYNRGLLRKHNAKGAINYGPYMSLAVSFFGIMIAVFLFYELVGYYVGFIRLNLPAALVSLNFLSFLVQQFSRVNLAYVFYVKFLAFGLAISALAAYLTVRFMYSKGLEHSKR